MLAPGFNYLLGSRRCAATTMVLTFCIGYTSLWYLKKVWCIIPTYEAFVQSDPDDNSLATKEEGVRRYFGELRYCKGQVCVC